MSTVPASAAPTDGASWHLIAGSTGAGKTTYARALAERIGGVCFSVDEWMHQLFWPDLPEKNDFAWAMKRVERCEAQVAVVAAQLALRGVSSVVDFGLTTRAQREGWGWRAKSAGVSVELHTLELPPEVRWSRVQERNAEAQGPLFFQLRSRCSKAWRRIGNRLTRPRPQTLLASTALQSSYGSGALRSR